MAIPVLHTAHIVALFCAERVSLLQAHTRNRQERVRNQEEAAQGRQSPESHPKSEKRIMNARNDRNHIFSIIVVYLTNSIFFYCCDLLSTQIK